MGGPGYSFQGSSEATTGDASFGGSKQSGIIFGSMANGLDMRWVIAGIVLVAIVFLMKR